MDYFLYFSKKNMNVDSKYFVPRTWNKEFVQKSTEDWLSKNSRVYKRKMGIDRYQSKGANVLKKSKISWLYGMDGLEFSD